jgi:SAM-dependent methyltransferase
MKLSELVAYRNRLDGLGIDEIHNQARRQLDAVRHVVSEHYIQLGSYSKNLDEKFSIVTDSFNQFDSVLTELKQELDVLIAEQQGSYFAESSRLFEQEMCWDTCEYILNRRLHIDDESNIVMLSRLRSYTDWRVPGMIMRPGTESFIEHLVPLDPLYIVDTHEDLITPSMDKFGEAYRARLRPYVITEDTGPVLDQLPVGQFGLVFAYNFFNYRPIELIEKYLKEVFHRLRPGGVFIMTYNDCDQAHGVALAEASFMCYTPGSRIQTLAEQAGFEIIFRHTGLGDLTWVELQRPGDITSLRGGQPLAKIVAKPK